jgi:hypothetical protein
MTQITNKSLEVVFTRPNQDGSFEGDTLRHLQALGAQRLVVMLCFPP